MKILVTGSRDWTDRKTLQDALREYNAADNILIEGGAKGADRIAREFAEDCVWSIMTVLAQWEKYGKSAGPTRNREMLDMQPDIVLAFPTKDSKGTIDCINQAIWRQIPVEIYYEVK